MTLADQIIEHGRWNDAGRIMCTVEMAELNALRDELIERRKFRAAAEARERYEVSVSAFRDGEGAYVAMRHGDCDVAEYEDDAGGPVIALAELVRRGDEHTEECGR